MASLTIRKLDDAVKAYLRLRSAGNGRSVEEEVRVILRRPHTGPPLRPGATCPALTASNGRAAPRVPARRCDR